MAAEMWLDKMLAEDRRHQRIDEIAVLHLQLLNIGNGSTKEGRVFMTKLYQEQVDGLSGKVKEAGPETAIQDMLSRVRNDPFLGPILNRVENRERGRDLEARQRALAEQGVDRPSAEDVVRMRRIATAGRRRP